MTREKKRKLNVREKSEIVIACEMLTVGSFGTFFAAIFAMGKSHRILPDYELTRSDWYVH